MRPRLPLVSFLATLLSLTSTSSTNAQTQWEPVWSDEFDGTSVDSDKWSFQIGDGCNISPLLCGWGNNELQYYREENATVEGGVLTISAREESFGGRSYTSARMRTLDKGDWKYGRFEISAKLPVGRGLWPAIWMLPTESVYGSWAASGEIDIVELFGHEPDVVLGTLHYGGVIPANVQSGASYRLPSGDFSQGFHVFAFEWDPWEMRWFVDNELYQTQRNWYTESAVYPAPFDQPFHILLNVAVGGDAVGPPDATTSFPQTMEVDYVKVYRATNADPSVSLLNPVDGQDFTDGTSMTLQAEASDTDGSVTRVEFLQEDGVLGVVRQAPYDLDVPNLYPGCYSVRAVAVDDVGRTASAGPLAVTVGGGCAVQSPYRMAAAPIPGAIEAEYFDLGGNGVAYNDLDQGNAGNGGIRTSDDVDISRAGSDIGFAVTRILRGEWLEFTVDVKEAGTYQAIVRASSVGTSASFRLEFNGEDKTGRVIVPSTGDEVVWTNVVVNNVVLGAGVQTMRFAANSSGIGLNRILFQRSGSTAVDPVPDESGLKLFQNYPNPFRGKTTIEYETLGVGEARILVFDLLGREVARPVSGPHMPGKHRIDFAADGLAPGSYVYRLESRNYRISKLLTLLP